MENVIEFETNLYMEDSVRRIPMGKHFNRMELRIHKGGKSGCIIWNYGKKAANEDETVIGLWFNGNKELEDYDGVYDLPAHAIELIKRNGYSLDADMRETYPQD